MAVIKPKKYDVMQTKETYYIKRGEEFIPISEYDSDITDSFKYGTHLVVNHLGCKMYSYEIEPDNAAMIASLKIFKEYLVKRMYVAGEASPKNGSRVPFTEKQMKAYNKLKEELGEHTHYFEFPALNDIVDKALKDFMEFSGDKYKDYPFVKKAYDNLLLKIKLCIDKAE